MRRALILVLASACSDGRLSERDLRAIDALAADNQAWIGRDPELVKLKLIKMQRNEYDWMRGSAPLYWRDVAEGDPLLATSFTAPPVLIVGDPHPENLGTFRAGDGTMLVDWNDLDAAGYGQAIDDLRRLAIGMVMATHGDHGDEDLVRAIAAGYSAQLAELARGGGPFVLGEGVHPLIDDELDDAEDEGDARLAVTTAAPAAGAMRILALGDIEPVAKDGVFEDSLFAVSAMETARIDEAVTRWAAQRGAPVTIKLRARRIGAGVASYPALRYNVVLEGATAELGDDELIELKEERDSALIAGAIELGAWPSPAARVTDAQRRVQARGDEDTLLGFADEAGTSFKIRDREAYQRGLAHGDIDALDTGDLLALGELLGRRLASAHGGALDPRGRPGWMALAPVFAGRDGELADELVATALAEADREAGDHDALADEDLGALVLDR